MCVVAEPRWKKLSADSIGPLLLLASARWNGVDSFRRIANQLRCQGPDIVGEIDIFREPTDDVVRLRESSAAFEDEVGAELRFEERGKRTNDPDVLL
jgi:hypothetical protein